MVLSNFEKIDNHVIFAGDFNVFFDASLDTKGGTQTLKNLSMNKLIELNKTLDLFDIGRMKTRKKYKYTS